MKRSESGSLAPSEPACVCLRARAGADAATPEPSERRLRRAPTQITLVLVGAASLGGCGAPEPTTMVQRDVYEHRSQCARDWGEERDCELATEGQHRGYWIGPGYSGARTARSDSPRVGTITEPARADGSNTTRVPRSGFGSSARSYSGGS